MTLTKDYILLKLRELKPVLQEQYGLSELALFGSYARGEQHEGSDIDLMVDYSDKSFRNFMRSIDVLEAAFPGIMIQAVSKGGIKPKYFECIKEDLIYA